jgi:hypothetical protein
MPEEGKAPPKQPKFGPSYIPSRAFSSALLSLVVDTSTVLGVDIAEHGAGGGLDITVGSDVGFPPAPFKVDIDGEVFEVTASTGTVWKVTATGTAAHKAGATVTVVRQAPPTAQEVLADLERNLPRLPAGPLKKSMETFFLTAGKDLGQWQTAVEQWFDDKMDRVSGWYKRRTKWWVLLWGTMIVLAFNADSISIVRTLYSNSTIRASLVNAAQSVAASPTSSGSCVAPSHPGATTTARAGSLECLADEVSSIEQLGLPMGWNRKGPGWPHGWQDVGLKIAGLFVTALALTLGAAFWFDLLNKVVNLRAAGKPPPKQDQAPSQQAPTTSGGP